MNPPLVRRRLRLVAANLFACVLVLMAAEGVLALRVPRDGWHDGTLYTFGVPVVAEQDFRAPVDLRPADSPPRVVVLGDSPARLNAVYGRRLADLLATPGAS